MEPVTGSLNLEPIKSRFEALQFNPYGLSEHREATEDIPALVAEVERLREVGSILAQWVIEEYGSPEMGSSEKDIAFYVDADPAELRNL